MAKDRINLAGFLDATATTNKVFEAVVPTEAYADNYGTFGRRLNVERLPQTHVIDAMLHRYDSRYETTVIESGMSELVDIGSITRSLESNVVALSYDKGVPFATGLLIHPMLILTARHCIEGRSIDGLVARPNFQKSVDDSMIFGFREPITAIIEANEEYDYAIIKLSRPIEFNKIAFDFSTSNPSGSSIFFHHPRGGPKKLSVHATFESIYEMLNYAAFHDSQKGSSGGVYVNANSKVFALHCLNMKGIITAQLMANIYSASRVLQSLYTRAGVQADRFSDLPAHREYSYISESEISAPYRAFLEVLETKPHGYPELNSNSRAGKQDLTYHHIIPKSNMEFLWMLGKENERIEKLLKKLSWQYNNTDENGVTAYAVIWAPWNLFIGPGSGFRPKGEEPGFDPKLPYAMEPLKPISFPKDFWDRLVALHNSIETCWGKRVRISQLSKDLTIKIIDRMPGSPEALKEAKIKATKEYSVSLIELLECLRAIASHEKTEQSYKAINCTTDEDWKLYPEFRKDGQLNRQYLLRKNSSDGVPAIGLMDSRITEMEHLKQSAIDKILKQGRRTRGAERDEAKSPHR